jgi:peptidoglycan/LPS O-acetylase OafA/YrhL
MSETSQAIKNLRASAAIMVVSFHASLAYVVSQPATRGPFGEPPFNWLAFPVVDPQRWFGFDLYAAFQYLSLMPLMFFLSGIFVWGSLKRKGARTYLTGRLIRILLPCVLGTYLLMPIAYYPAFAITVPHPSWEAYWHEFFALPFWPCGPLWFLWELFAIDAFALALLSLSPELIEPLKRWAQVGERPGRYFVLLFALSAAAYVPWSLFTGAGKWIELGPLALQSDRVLLYPVYFFAGVGIGAYGYERGLLAADGPLARRWRFWLGACFGTYFLWMISMAPSFAGYHNPALDVLTGLAMVLAIAAGCLGPIALFLRFGTIRSWITESIARHAYGIYLVHYLPVVWLQYLLISSDLPAVVKGALVFTAALTTSWAVNAAYGRCADSIFSRGISLLGGRPWPRSRPSHPLPAGPSQPAGSSPGNAGR